MPVAKTQDAKCRGVRVRRTGRIQCWLNLSRRNTLLARPPGRQVLARSSVLSSQGVCF